MVVEWFGCPAMAATGHGVRCTSHRRATTCRMHGAEAPCVQASELQAAFARGFGQRLDAAVEAIARAVEGDLLDPHGARLLGDRLADLGRGVAVAAVLQALAHVGLGGVGGGQHLRAIGAEQLRIHVLSGAQHRQARHAEFADARAGGLGAAQAGDLLVHGSVLRKLKASDYAFLASLRMMVSSEYFTPLPLYGSGGRKPRILAASSPPRCLSARLTRISVWVGVAMVMPSAALNSTGCENPSERFRSLPCMAAR